ncbi:MAG: ABC transporter transmembrane domain-containing protein [Clostridium paraputrificum]
MCSIFSKVFMLLIPYLTKLLFDYIEIKNMHSFISSSIYLVVSMLFFQIFLCLKNYFQNYLNLSISNLLKKDIVNKSFKLDLYALSSITTGEFIQKLFNDTENVKPLIITMYIDFFINIIYLVCICIIMLFLNPALTLFLLFLFPIFIFFYKKYMPNIEQVNAKIIKSDEELKTISEDVLNGNLDLRINNAYSYILNRFNAKLTKYFDLNMLNTKYSIKYNYILVTGIMNFATLIIYCLGGLFVLNNSITVGTLISFNLYFSRMWDPVEYLMNLSKDFKIQNISFKRITDFLNFDLDSSNNVYDDKNLPEFKKIQLDSVSLSYNDNSIFNDLNLIINKMDKIGVRGENGSGKSTLSKLLVKLITNYDGNIYYNNLNYDNISSLALRQKVILIPSNPFIFNDTILNNILLSNDMDSNLDNNDLLSLLNKNNINLYDTINNNNIKLSGGEQKIVQLLRGISLNGDIYIIDEPLNYVDKKYKKIIIDFIKNNLNDKTLIIISHDESIFDCCDKIYNLSNGQLSPCIL